MTESQHGNKTIKMHEIVVPTAPLSVWYYIFYGDNNESYVAPHWHRGIELSYTISGTINDFTIKKEHFRTKPGQILVVNTQVIHSVVAHNRGNGKALSIIFPFDYVANYYPDIKHQVIEINDYNKLNDDQKLAYSDLQGLLMQFYLIYFSDLKFKFLQMQELVDQVLLLLMSKFTKENDQVQDISQRKIYATNRLLLITQYVNKHFQENITLDSIARSCHISKEYLARFFKKQMEITVDTYINNVRAQYAHNELRNSNHSLTEVALNNGFSGVRTMNRAFEKLYNKTASQFKREFKNK